MLRGIVLASSQNWAGSSARQEATIGTRKGAEFERTRNVDLTRDSRKEDREKQEQRKESTSALWEYGEFQHSLHKPSGLETSQNLETASRRYLPERRRTCVVAFSTSQEEEEQKGHSIGFQPPPGSEYLRFLWNLAHRDILISKADVQCFRLSWPLGPQL